MQPTFTVFAGPNGAGKSTIILAPEFANRRTNLLEADAIAKRMDPAVPVRAAVAAGREVILRTREFLASGESFAMETTSILREPQCGYNAGGTTLRLSG